MKFDREPVRQKRCKNRKCRKLYSGDDIDIAFRKVSARYTSQKDIEYRGVCIFCDQDRRTERTRKNRWKAKARDTRRAHARKFGISQKELEEKHGWVISQMAHTAEFQYNNGCPECHHSFAEMGNGHADITLDIIDPRLEPGLGNTKWICRTCNSAKGNKTPQQWLAQKRLWRERDIWLKEQALLAKPKQLQLL